MQFLVRPPRRGTWIPPVDDAIKLNCDGSVSDLRSIRGLTRSSTGHLKFPFRGRYDSESILVLEIKSIEIGLHYCLNLGYKKVWVASDSLGANQVSRNKEVEPGFAGTR